MKLPFEYVRKHVYPIRKQKENKKWWLHERPDQAMRAALAKLHRYIVTPHVSKHRIFVWIKLVLFQTIS